MSKKENVVFLPFPGVRHHQVVHAAEEDKKTRKMSTQIFRVTKKKKNKTKGSFTLATTGKINTGSTDGEETEYTINAHNFAPKDKEWKTAKKCKICHQVFTVADPPYFCRNSGCSYRAHAFCLIFPDKISQCQKAKQKATRSQSVGMENTNSLSTTHLFNTLAAQIAQKPKTSAPIEPDYNQQERNEQIQINSECAFSLMLGIREVLQFSRLQIKEFKTRKKQLKQQEIKLREYIKKLWDEITQLIDEKLQITKVDKIGTIINEYETSIDLLESCLNRLENNEIDHLQDIYQSSYPVDSQTKSKFNMNQSFEFHSPYQSMEVEKDESTTPNSILSPTAVSPNLSERKANDDDRRFAESMHDTLEVLQSTLKLNEFVEKLMPQVSTSDSLDDHEFIKTLRSLQDSIQESINEIEIINEKNEENENLIRKSNENLLKIHELLLQSSRSSVNEDDLAVSSADQLRRRSGDAIENLFNEGISVLTKSDGILTSEVSEIFTDFRKTSENIPGSDPLINLKPPDLPPISIETVDSVTGTSIEDLIELVVDTRVNNIFSFSLTFLRCYRYFMSTEKLLTQLVIRYCCAPSHTNNKLISHREKQTSVRLRILVFLKYWITACSEDFVDPNSPAYHLLMHFLCQTAVKTGHSDIVKQLLRVLGKIQTTYNQSLTTILTLNAKLTFDNNDEIIGQFSLLKYSPEIFAKYLTHYEHTRFCLLKPGEFLCQRYTKSNHQIMAPNITQLTNHFNNFIGWIWKEILTPDRPETRAEVLRHSLLICCHLYELGNFFGLIEFLAALNGSCITRLRHTWCIAGENLFQLKEDFGFLTYKNYAVLRKEILQKNPPIVPFIGMYLGDLTFFDEGNPNFIDGKINFGYKFNKISETVSSILRFQDFAYDFTADEKFTFCVSNLRTITSEEAFRLSEAREPRSAVAHLPRFQKEKGDEGDDFNVDERIAFLHTTYKSLLQDPTPINAVNFIYINPSKGDDNLFNTPRKTTKISRLKGFSSTLVASK